MTTTERLTIGLNGLQLAWESVSVVVGALLVELLVGFLVRARAGRRAVAAAGSPARQRELESLRRVAAELARTSDVEGVARALLDEIASLFGVGFVALTFVSEDGREASGFLARAGAKDVAWWPDVTLDLAREPSGVASAVFEASSFAVYDATGSTRVSPRLARETGAKSAAFIPLTSEGRVMAVISVATTDDFRAFSTEDLSVMQTLASEATIALERTRTSIELGAALERERLLASVGRRLRSELDLQAALRTVVAETGRALGGVRCFVRLGESEMLAEWRAGTLTPIDSPSDLPVSNLALREQRTVTLVDLDEAPELSDAVTGGIENLRALGSRSVIATPVRVQDVVIGVLSVHSDVPRTWVQADTALLESVAAEVGNAIRVGRLLDENRERLSQQAALLRAAQVLSGELDLDTVLQRLVHEVAELLQADASDCYLYDPERAVLRCAAVHGLDPALVGFEFPATRGLAALAIREGRAMTADEYDALGDPVPNEAYDG